MFNTLDVLSRSLDAAWLRNEIISNNIANADTPGYKAKAVVFEQALQDAREKDRLKVKSTSNNESHIELKTERQLEPVVINKENTRARPDGNNVEIEIEMAELAKNQMFYTALTQHVIKQFQMLQTVISEGRR